MCTSPALSEAAVVRNDFRSGANKSSHDAGKGEGAAAGGRAGGVGCYDRAWISRFNFHVRC